MSLGGDTNPSPFPPYPKMRKCALPSLPRLSEMSPWCVCGGVAPFCAPHGAGAGKCSGETRPQIPAQTPTPQHHPPWGGGHSCHAGIVPRMGISQRSPRLGTPPCSPPRAVPCQGTLLSPAPVPVAVRHPLPQTAVPAGGSGGHHMSLLNPSHSWGFLQTPTCPPARPARAPAP